MAALVTLWLASTDFALVVTNNRSLTLGRPDLRYADDDGVQYAKLFAQQMGAERVTLLTRFDVETARLHKQDIAPATGANVRARVAALAKDIAEARARGEATSVTLVFAGHGDIDHGQGFVELEDERLTAAMLDTEVIGKLGADRIHLVLDSCNSYFMLSPRKAGGVRTRAKVDAQAALLEKYPNLGALISTSAEALTYEWSELQSGIFSYLVRSGLRGAADANADGRISYKEIAAFVDTATADIVNEQYRPHVFVAAPKTSIDEALTAPNMQRGKYLIELKRGEAKRLTVRDRQGVRVLDLNADGSQPVRVLLPDDDGPFEIIEYRDGQPVRPSVAARGEAPLFGALFQSPFGARAVAAYEERARNKPPPVYGISRRDTDRLDLHLSAHAGFATELRLRSGVSLVFGAASVAGVISSMISITATYEPRWDVTKTTMTITGGVAVTAIAAAGIAVLAKQSDAEKLLLKYRQENFSSEETRAEAVVTAEAALEQLVIRDRRARRSTGIVTLATGGASIGSSALSLALASIRRTPEPWQWAGAIATTCVGIGTLVTGYYMLRHWRAPSTPKTIRLAASCLCPRFR